MGGFEAFWDIRQMPEYLIDPQSSALAGEQDLKVLRNFVSPELGFSFKKDQGAAPVHRITVYNEATKQPINAGTYDTDGKFIVFAAAFKENQAGIPPAKRIPLNEMGMQNFLTAAGEKAKNLKAAFLFDVQNKEFWAITKQNYDDMKQSFDKVLTFERGSPQFDRYMGSPKF